jgi:hypothetical protein
MLSSLTSFVQPFGIAPVGIVAVLSVLVIVGLVAGIYQEAKLRKITQERRRWLRAASYPDQIDENGPSADT